VLVGLDYLKTV